MEWSLELIKKNTKTRNLQSVLARECHKRATRKLEKTQKRTRKWEKKSFLFLQAGSFFFFFFLKVNAGRFLLAMFSSLFSSRICPYGNGFGLDTFFNM